MDRNEKNIFKNILFYLICPLKIFLSKLFFQPTWDSISGALDLGCMSEKSYTLFLLGSDFCDFWATHKAHLHDFFRSVLWHDKDLKNIMLEPEISNIFQILLTIKLLYFFITL